MQIVLNLQGHRLLAGIRQTLSSGSKEVDEIKLEVDETWKGFGKIAVFCVGKKCQYTVVDEVTQTAKIPAEVLRNEAVITIGIVGFKDEAVMTSTLVAYQVEKGSVVTIEEPEPSIYAEILSRYADLATRLNNIIANAGDLTNNAELIDARVGADDVVYDTLGEAVRGQVGSLSEENDNPSIYALDLVQKTMGTENLWDQGGIEINYTGGTYKYVYKEIPIEPGTYTVYVGYGDIEGIADTGVFIGYDIQNSIKGAMYSELKTLKPINVDENNQNFSNKLVIKIQASLSAENPNKKRFYIDNILIFKGDITSKPGIPIYFVDGVSEQLYKNQSQKISKVIGKNKFDKETATDNYFVNTNGNFITNKYSYNYFISDFIPAKPGIYYSKSPFESFNICIAFYDANKKFLKSYQYDTDGDIPYLSPENTSYLVFTGSVPHKDTIQIEEGQEKTDYEEYTEYKPFTDFEKSTTNKIKTIEDNISQIEGYKEEHDFYKEEKRDIFSNQEVISFENIPNCKKDNVISFYANVSEFDKIGISHGKVNYRCGFIEIDNTNLYVYSNESTVRNTFAHELIIQDFLSVIVNILCNNTADVTITTIGGTFKKNVSWNGCRDNILFESNGSSFTNAKATFMLNDLKKALWCFGDSYFDFWSIKMDSLGFSNFYSDAYSGRASSGAMVSLRNALNVRLPKKIYWCMGMNDPDQSDSINQNWKDVTDELISICSENKIELIFSTIPTTPINNHKYKNDYIRNSGYNYVDIEKALVKNAETGEWYEGLISSDKIHPSANGTNIIISVNIANFPEMKN